MSATPNPNQVMSTLRMLGDQELGQYAKMHKADPYIFPLAFQESMLRKQMRAQGAAPQQGAGAPPPVNEQALASMQQLPENSGIARIAPPGVATMAAGGIVGFAGDASSLVATPAMDGLRWEDLPPVPGDSEEMPSIRFANSIKGAFSSEKRIDPKTGKAISFGEFMNRANGTKAPPNENYGNEGLRQPGPPGPQAAAPAAPAPAAQRPAAGLGALADGAGGRTGSSISLSTRGGVAGAGAPGIPRMEAPAAPEKFDSDKYFDERMAKPTVDPLESQRKALTDADAAAAQRQYEGMKGVSAKQDALYDKQGAILDTRAADLGKEDKRNEAMSWITAGLEMLQARGPGLAAIAGGAKKGIDFRAAGLEKIKTAQERIDEARVKVEEARLGSEKEKVGAQAALDKALNDGKKVMFGGLENAFNMKHSEAMNAVKMKADENMKSRELYNQWGISNNNNATTMAAAQLQASTQLRAAEIQAAASRAGANKNPQLEMFREMGGGDAVKGAQAYFSAQQGKADPLGVIAKYRESLPDIAITKGGLSKSSPPEQIMAAILADVAAYSRVSAPRPAPVQNASGAAAVRP